MAAITQLRKRKHVFRLCLRLSTERSPLEGTVELIRGLAPFLGGGGSGSRLEELAELLRQFSPFLAFRSSLLQKVASSNPVTDEGVRRGQFRNLSSKFSLQVDDQLLTTAS